MEVEADVRNSEYCEEMRKENVPGVEEDEVTITDVRTGNEEISKQQGMVSGQLEDVDMQIVRGEETRKKMGLGQGIGKQESMIGVVTRRRNLMPKFGPFTCRCNVSREMDYIYIYISFVHYVYEN